MKKIKSLFVIVTTIIMISVLSSFLFANSVFAVKYYEPSERVPVCATNVYEFNAGELQNFYADKQHDNTLQLKQRMNVTEADISTKKAVPVYQYNSDGTLEAADGGFWQDGQINTRHASAMLILQKGYGSVREPSSEEKTIEWQKDADDFVFSLIEGTKLNNGAKTLTANDITVAVNVKTPAISAINSTEDSYEINSNALFTTALGAKINNAKKHKWSIL